MITIRRSDDRGRTRLPWLDGRHTFSFGTYYDPRFAGFRALRVINDDVVSPAGGFDTHPHSDMEIVTIVLEGALRHRDNMGNGSIIRPGDVQRMTAGTGVSHSEHNNSTRERVRLLQIWITPEAQGLQPGYEQSSFDTAARSGEWVVVAASDGRGDAVTIRQDVDLHRAHVRPGAILDVSLRPGRHGWLHVVSGSVTLDGEALAEGDAAALSEVENTALVGVVEADVLFFDLA